ncbi:MAG: hypothetical protein ABI954_08750 [Pyrinomonadaceae bacterium]
MPSLEKSADPIMFESMDLREVIKAFKEKLGEQISITKMIIERDTVTISVKSGQDVGEFQYANKAVTKLSAANRLLPEPKVETAFFDSSLQSNEPIKILTVPESFEIDEIPLIMLPQVVKLATKQLWIDGAKVEKIVIEGHPEAWAITVRGTQNKVEHHFAVTTASIGNNDGGYVTSLTIHYLSNAKDLQKKIGEIKENVGGRLRLLELRISSRSIELTAQDPNKPAEFNQFTFFNDGTKWNPRPVSDSELRHRLEAAKLMHPNAKVGSLEDALFDIDDIDLNHFSEMVEITLNKLRLEKSKVTGINIFPDWDRRVIGEQMKWRVGVDADSNRKSGTAFFDMKGHLLEIKEN